jgi:DNA-binding NarL/FixJ family response regulator
VSTYRYVTSEHRNAKYAHIGNPTLCGRLFIRPRVTDNAPADRAVCRACVKEATGLGWITAAEARKMLGLTSRKPREREPRHGAHLLVPLMIEGCNERDVAARIGISTRTVNRLVADAMRALGARTRFQWGYLVGVAAR